MSALDKEALAAALRVAVGAAEAAGRVALASWRSAGLEVETKADGTPVTEADKAAERTIREILEAAPESRDFAVVGEEYGGDAAASRYHWLLDPIDGTKSYTRGLPLFGTLVALIDGASGRSQLGVIRLPALAETYAAGRGLGATCNGRPIRVSAKADLATALISTPDSGQFAQGLMEADYRRLRGHVPHLRGYPDCFAHAMAARGALDGVLEPSLNTWDAMATEVLIEEAGGSFLMRRCRAQPADGRTALDVLFGSPPLVERIAKLIEF